MNHSPLKVPILAAATLLTYVQKKQKARHRKEQQGPKKRKRVRRSVKDIYDELRPIYFRRAYRMKYESFVKFIDVWLLPFLPQC